MVNFFVKLRYNRKFLRSIKIFIYHLNLFLEPGLILYVPFDKPRYIPLILSLDTLNLTYLLEQFFLRIKQLIFSYNAHIHTKTSVIEIRLLIQLFYQSLETESSRVMLVELFQ